MANLKQKINVLIDYYIKLCGEVNNIAFMESLSENELKEFIINFDEVEDSLYNLIVEYNQYCELSNQPINLSFQKLLDKISRV